MIKYLTALILCGNMTAFAQSTMELSISPLKMNNAVITVDNRAKDTGAVIGSPYYNEVFQPSVVENYPDGLSLRYNAHTGDMEFEFHGVLYALLKEEYPEVYLGAEKKHYVYLPYEHNGKAELGFIVKLNENENFPAYKKEWIDYIEPKAARSHYEADTPAYYRQKNPKFYIYWNGRVREVPARRKKFSKIFGNRQNAVYKYIKKNSIDIRSEKGIRQLSDYLENHFSTE